MLGLLFCFIFFPSSEIVKSKSFVMAGAPVSKHLLSAQLRLWGEGARVLQSWLGVWDRLCL